MHSEFARTLFQVSGPHLYAKLIHLARIDRAVTHSRHGLKYAHSRCDAKGESGKTIPDFSVVEDAKKVGRAKHLLSFGRAVVLLMILPSRLASGLEAISYPTIPCLRSTKSLRSHVDVVCSSSSGVTNQSALASCTYMYASLARMHSPLERWTRQHSLLEG